MELFTLSFTTFFATVGPIDVAAMFVVLAQKSSTRSRRSMALRGTAVATGILITFALLGHYIISYLGISHASLRTAGGVLLLLIAIDMVFARPSGGRSTSADENEEATSKTDISVFPLATPLIAGPGAIGVAILLMADAQGDLLQQSMVVSALLLVMVLTLLALLGASYLNKLLGVTGMHVITRVFGVLLTALAIQFIFDGIKQSGLL